MKNREFYWDWLKHENQILASRGNFFLVAESMLLMAVATLWTDNPMERTRLIFMFGISATGLIISWIWLQVNVKHICGTHKAIGQKLKRIEPRWRNTKQLRDRLLRQKAKNSRMLPCNRTFILVIKDKAMSGENSYRLPGNHYIFGILMPAAVLFLWVCICVFLFYLLILLPMWNN